MEHLSVLAVQNFLVPRLGPLPEVQQAVARGREDHAQFAHLPFAAHQVRGHLFRLSYFQSSPKVSDRR